MRWLIENAKYVRQHCKRMANLLSRYEMDILSVRCDGLIDSPIPDGLKMA